VKKDRKTDDRGGKFDSLYYLMLRNAIVVAIAMSSWLSGGQRPEFDACRMWLSIFLE
jgi:hypothetical protein